MERHFIDHLLPSYKVARRRFTAVLQKVSELNVMQDRRTSIPHSLRQELVLASAALLQTGLQ